MFTEGKRGQDILVRAFEVSEGKTVDLVVDQEVRGVTPEMFQWWTTQIATRYTIWFPQAHLSAKIEMPPGDGPPTIIIEENIGEFYTVFRCLPTEEGLTMLTPDDKPMGGLIHQPEPSPTGIKLHSVFTFPAKTPQRFLDDMRQHCKDEMQDLPRFLPELYRREAK